MQNTDTTLIAWIAVAEFGLALITAIIHLVYSVRASSARALALMVAHELDVRERVNKRR